MAVVSWEAGFTAPSEGAIGGPAVPPGASATTILAQSSSVPLASSRPTIVVL